MLSNEIGWAAYTFHFICKSAHHIFHGLLHRLSFMAFEITVSPKLEAGVIVTVVRTLHLSTAEA